MLANSPKRMQAPHQQTRGISAMPITIHCADDHVGSRPYSKYFCSKRGVRCRSLDVAGASASSFVACNNAFKNMFILHTFKTRFSDLLLIKALMAHY
jgi:hypothetical protein